MKTNTLLARTPTDATLNTDRRAMPSLIGGLGRRMLLARLARLRAGQIRVREHGVTMSFGAPDAECPLAAEIEVLDGRFWGDVAFGGSVGAGEAYIRGYWRASDDHVMMTGPVAVEFAGRLK